MTWTKFEIPYGPEKIKVFGIIFSRLPLFEIDDLEVSITRRNPYQIERKWPEHGSVNINKKWSHKTTEKNWYGYVHPKSKSIGKLRVLLDKYDIVNAHARIINVLNSLEMELMIPRDF